MGIAKYLIWGPAESDLRGMVWGGIDVFPLFFCVLLSSMFFCVRLSSVRGMDISWQRLTFALPAEDCGEPKGSVYFFVFRNLENASK